MGQSSDYRIAHGVHGILADFNQVGLIESTDIHVARTLSSAVGEDDERVLLAIALLVAHTRAGSVCLDLATVAQEQPDAGPDLAGAPLPWPPETEWIALIAGSPTTQRSDPALTLRGTLLYLDRYVRHEDHLLRLIQARRGARPVVDTALLDTDIARLFRFDVDEHQQQAVVTAVKRQFTVIAGGPGTGKTTTIGKIVAALQSQLLAGTTVHPMIALAAPTGRAAARLQEAVQGSATTLDVDPTIARAIAGTSASTLHRLLGWQPGNRSRFVHHRGNPLPHDVVIVDESSMISLALMDQLLDAVRPDARVVLVGDPKQLASVDAGSVFGDIVGHTTVGDEEAGVVVLARIHRFGGEISDLAAAVLGGDADAAELILRRSSDSIVWYEVSDDVDAATARASAIAELTPHWLDLVDTAMRGDAKAASGTVMNARILCAHREGPAGVSDWNDRAFWSLADRRPIGRSPDAWFAGRPLLVAGNDYELGVFNGDSGVAISDSGGGYVAVFDREPEPFLVNPARLGNVATAFASTVHKSQGSQFGVVVVVLPNPDSHVLSRELLYTAVT
ncbi:MAG: exodeoxyribonuclease V subunit alpha, partial [Actinobacteria bacterium]|nr:exodeoxyribonuclease V subunit alpha [Actinomycetota bacterium]